MLWRRTKEGGYNRVMTERVQAAALDSSAVDVVADAFHLACKFIEKDVEIARINPQERHNLLAKHLVRVAATGVLETRRLANEGIGYLRGVILIRSARSCRR